MSFNREHCRTQYGRKDSTPTPYRWKPPCNQFTKKVKDIGLGSGIVLPDCDPVRGIDNKTTYVGDRVIVNGIVNNLAYVECDYVE